MPEYRKFARWGKDRGSDIVNYVKAHPDDVLRYGIALPAGVLAGGLTFAATNDAVAGERAMVLPALAYAIGEGFHAAKNREGNIIEIAGSMGAVLAPAVGACFAADNSYNPLLTMGMTLPYGLSKLVEKIGRAKEIDRIAKEYQELGRDAMLEDLGELPNGQLAKIAALAKRSNKR
jgi:hypothetical protein